METMLHITGALPENWDKALLELKDDLGFVAGETGIPVTAVKGEEPAVVCDGQSVTVLYSSTAA